MIAFLCALPQEAKHLRRFPIIQAGQAQLIVCGVGPTNAERATRKLLNDSKPTLVISTGVAGALSPTLKIGDVVVAAEIVDESTGRRFPCIQQPRNNRGSRKLSESSIGNRQSAILSVSRMITSAEEKKSLFRKHGAVAVDMESAAIARVCAEHGVPFAAVRAISDTADEVLPEAVTRFFDANGGLRIGRVLAEVVKNPSLLRTLLRLQSQTATACDSLRRLLEASPIDEL